MKKILILLLFWGSIGMAQNVGIGTMSPTASLHVGEDVGDGNMRIRNTPELSNALDLAWGKESKRVGILNDSNERLFYLIKYKFKLNYKNGKGESEDWISDFDTKIPVDKYFSFVTRSRLFLEREGESYSNSFPTASQDYEIGLNHVEDSNNTLNPVKVVSVFPKEGTWHIKADFEGATPYVKNPRENNIFVWDIDILSVKKAIVKDYGDKTIDASSGINVSDNSPFTK